MKRQLWIPVITAAALFSSMIPIGRTEAQPPLLSVYLDGKLLEMTASPYIEEGVTMVPFRPIFEALHLQVAWDKSAQTVAGTNDWSSVKLTAGDRTALVNNNEVSMETAAKLKEGALFVPLRFVGEQTGNAVSWNQAARRIDIRTGSGMQGRLAGSNVNGRAIQLLQFADGELRKVADGVTDANGNYRFVGLEKGEDYAIAGVWPDNADIRTCTFKYRNMGNCSQLALEDHQAAFRVLDPNGSPIFNYSLEIRLERTEYNEYTRPNIGAFNWDSLKDGESYTASVQLPPELQIRYAPGVPYTFTFHAGEHVIHQFRLADLPDAQATGKLVDEAGKPLADRTVNISKTDQDGPSVAVKTQSDGSFAFRGLVNGQNYSYNVSVSSHEKPLIGDFMPSNMKTFTYSGSPMELGALTLNRIQLIGRLTDGEGKPHSGLGSLKDASGNYVGQAIAYSDGYAAIGGMEEGKQYTWSLLGSDFYSSDAISFVSMIKSSAQPYTFVYKPGMAEAAFKVMLGSRYVTGRVKSSSGMIESGANVYVEFTVGGATVRSAAARTDAGGNFTIPMQENKQGRIYAVSADGLRKSPKVEFDIADSNASLPGLVVQ